MQKMDTPGSVAGARRSRNGCQQCRRRKRKCDEQHPRCMACLSRDLPCNWQRDESRKQQLARRSSQYNKDFTVPQEMRPLVTVFTVPSTPVKDTLLSHFQQNCSLWFTASLDTKSAACSEIILPIALRNPLILNCVLAIAAGDLSKSQPASSDLVSLTHGFYGQAVAGIQSALGKEISAATLNSQAICSNDDILLANMLLCVHEAVNFTATDRILPHIIAAATLCHSRCFDIAPNVPLRGLLFELFCYIFTLTGFAQGNRLPLHLALQIFSSPFLSDDYCNGLLLERQCREIFFIILKVSILTGDRTAIHISDEDTFSQLQTLERQLEQLPMDLYPGNDGTIPDGAKVSELYRLACLIHIKQLSWPNFKDSSAGIQSLVQEFVTVLGTLSPKSPANNIVGWPLVVAGSASVIVTHQRLIIGRLRKNHENWRSYILKKSADFLTRKWRENKASENEDLQPWEKEVFHPEPSKLGTTQHIFEIPVL